MNRELIEDMERQLFASAAPAPGELRGAVVGAVRRELAASRRDRWLGRTAAALVVVGVGLNGVVARQGSRDAEASLAGGTRSRETLVQTAAAVAEATDAATGQRMARQLAALGGWTLTDEQLAAIDAAALKGSRNPTEG